MEIIFGTWMEIGLFLFNIFLDDLFFIVNKIDIANYAYDDTPYATANDMDSLTPSRQILVPRTSRGRAPPTSPGRPLNLSGPLRTILGTSQSDVPGTF